MKKFVWLILIMFMTFFSGGCNSPASGGDDRDQPGAVWIEPSKSSISEGENFSTVIKVNTGLTEPVSCNAYTVTITFDPSIVSYDSENKISGPWGEPIINDNDSGSGKLVCTAFDIAAGDDVSGIWDFLEINWIAESTGTCEIGITVNSLADENGNVIVDTFYIPTTVVVFL